MSVYILDSLFVSLIANLMTYLFTRWLEEHGGK